MKPPTEDQMLRAVEIADSVMRSDIECECVWLEPIVRGEARLYCPTDQAGKKVTKLADAYVTVREAFAWLQERGQAELRKDRHGEYIVLLKPERDLIDAIKGEA